MNSTGHFGIAQEGFSIRLADDPAVEDDDGSRVGFAADQASDPFAVDGAAADFASAEFGIGDAEIFWPFGGNLVCFMNPWNQMTRFTRMFSAFVLSMGT